MFRQTSSTLFLVGTVATEIMSAVLVGYTFFLICPAGWPVAVKVIAALFAATIVESLKTAFSIKIPLLFKSGRYVSALVGLAFVASFFSFGTWAGHERYFHDLNSADAQLAIDKTLGMEVIDKQILALNAELAGLSEAHLVVADVSDDKKRLAGLYEQARLVRAKMGWSKANEMETTTIASVRADIQRKEDSAAAKNAAATEARTTRTAEIRSELNDLDAKRLKIAGATNQVSTDLETTSAIIMLFVITIELAPIVVLAMLSAESAPGRNGVAPLQSEATPTALIQPDPVAETPLLGEQVPEVIYSPAEPVLESSVVEDVLAMDQATALSQEAAESFSEVVEPVEAAIAKDPRFAPKIAAARDLISSVVSGSVISTNDVKSVVGSSGCVAPVLSYLSLEGLVSKAGRSWVRV